MADIRIDRDSVCAGDDTESHAAVIAVDDGLNLAAVVDQVLANRYLASISGGKASWIIYADGKAVGVAAQQWARPRYLRDCAEARAPKVLRFGYAQQRCPAEVLQMIQHD